MKVESVASSASTIDRTHRVFRPAGASTPLEHEEEIELAKRIELGELIDLRAIVSDPSGVAEIALLGDGGLVEGGVKTMENLPGRDRHDWNRSVRSPQASDVDR